MEDIQQIIRLNTTDVVQLKGKGRYSWKSHQNAFEESEIN